jgi:acetoin utilization deacetylase AcuC-like enzyme
MSFPIAFHPIYKHPLPDGHRFPMEKYELLPQQLLLEGIAEPSDFFTPKEVDLKHVLQVHDSNYVNHLLQLQLDAKHVRKIGFPLSNELVKRELIITQGTIMGATFAAKEGIAANIAGGTHHAYPSSGEAFCLLNDQGVAAKYLLQHKLAKKILMLDLDVHQGNGTAVMFQNEPSVFTFSMHGKSNYPFKKEVSDWDIALEDQTNDAIYLETLQNALRVIQKNFAPDFVFYLSGVDVLATDKLGKLGLSMQGCKNRDAMVFEWIKKLQVPVQVSMGGGYSKDIKLIIEAHTNTFREARNILK